MMHPHDILVETAKAWYEQQRSGPLEGLMYTWEELPDKARLDILDSAIHTMAIIRDNLFRRSYTTEELADYLNEQHDKKALREAMLKHPAGSVSKPRLTLYENTPTGRTIEHYFEEKE